MRWYYVISYADASFLQIFLWERLGAISPMPNEFKPVKTQKVIINGVEREK